MTKISTSIIGNLYTIKAEGHASNQDACSGISTLITALAGYLHNDASCMIMREVLKEGFAFISYKGGESAKAVYDMTIIGLKQLELVEKDSICFK